MDLKQADSTERDQLLDEVVTAYLKAVEAGQAPDRQELRARYPDLASELDQFFASQDDVRRWTAPLRSLAPPALPALGSAIPAFGDYEQLQEIGRGGMGVVYRAWQKSLGRVVALKMIRSGLLASETEVQLFRKEAETVAGLDHPQIVPIHEVGVWPADRVSPPVPYFTMKLIEGANLAGQLDRFRGDPRLAAGLVASLARAVHHAHQRGVLHCDLKPSNILLDWRAGEGSPPVPHVTDFGLARRLAADDSLTISGMLAGTPSYMAPEQAGAPAPSASDPGGGKKVRATTATDVYGLGAILYALLTGRPPFRGETVLDTLEQVKTREPESPSRSNRRVDRDLATVCLKCLEKEPARRYGSAEALAGDLERWLASEPIQARAISRLARIWRWCRRNPVVAGLATTTVGLFVVVLVGSLVSAVSIAQKQRQTATALGQAQEKQRLARQAVDEMYLQVAEKWLADQAQLTEVQQEFLRKALQFYEQFAREEGDEPEVRWDTAKAYDRVARIQQKLSGARPKPSGPSAKNWPSWRSWRPIFPRTRAIAHNRPLCITCSVLSTANSLRRRRKPSAGPWLSGRGWSRTSPPSPRTV
jgi:serine/threonine-protein kinase